MKWTESEENNQHHTTIIFFNRFYKKSSQHKKNNLLIFFVSQYSKRWLFLTSLWYNLYLPHVQSFHCFLVRSNGSAMFCFQSLKLRLSKFLPQHWRMSIHSCDEISTVCTSFNQWYHIRLVCCSLIGQKRFRCQNFVVRKKLKWSSQVPFITPTYKRTPVWQKFGLVPFFQSVYISNLWCHWLRKA